MRTKAKWLQSATMMAFLAIVALFVSPALALACCCHDAPPAVAALHCHDESAAAPASHHVEVGAQYAAIHDDCDCDSATTDAAFVASDNARFFAPLAVVVPAQKSLFSFVADARRAHPAHFAARPRLPDRTLFSGRAPPALAQS